MQTISQAVKETIQRSPFLMEAITEGVANNAKIAERLRPYVEKKLFKSVSLTSISMALHRLQGHFNKSNSAFDLLKQMHDITVRSNLVAFVFLNSADLPHVLEAVSKNSTRKKNTFLNFSRGLQESMFIVSRDFENEITAALKKGEKYSKIEELSAITMRLPEESFNTPGVYYPILKTIALEGISFVEVISVRAELSIIFEDKDVDQAFSVIKRITS